MVMFTSVRRPSSEPRAASRAQNNAEGATADGRAKGPLEHGEASLDAPSQPPPAYVAPSTSQARMLAPPGPAPQSVQPMQSTAKMPNFRSCFDERMAARSADAALCAARPERRAAAAAELARAAAIDWQTNTRYAALIRYLQQPHVDPDAAIQLLPSFYVTRDGLHVCFDRSRQAAMARYICITSLGTRPIHQRVGPVLLPIAAARDDLQCLDQLADGPCVGVAEAIEAALTALPSTLKPTLNLPSDATWRKRAAYVDGMNILGAALATALYPLDLCLSISDGGRLGATPCISQKGTEARF
jgi:hypothetical protein